MAAGCQDTHQELCIGDHVCLYSVNSAGYVFSDQTSSAQNRVYIHHNQDRLNPINIPNPEVVTFEVCIQKRYKLNRKLHFVNTNNITVSSEEFRHIQDAAAAESKDNQLEESRLLGKPVKYGDIIQLRHVFSRKSILVDTCNTSSYDKNKLMVHLKNYDAKNAQFRVLPMYKVNSKGEPVMLADQICLESVKVPGQFLHASKPLEFLGLDKCCELNVGVEASAFTLYCRVHRTPSSVDCKALQGGSVIQLHHRHMEAYLTAEGMFGTESMVTEAVHLKVRESDLRVPSTLYPPTTSATFWQIEAADSIIDGSPLYWGHYVRLRHYNTRQYLCIDNDKSVTLVKHPKEPRTVFQLHQMSFQKSNLTCVESGSSCRLQHAVTGFWLGGWKDKKYNRKTAKWMTEELRMVGCSEEMQYQDVFCLQFVVRHLVEDCNIISGMTGLIQYISTKANIFKTLDTAFMEALLMIIRELIAFISQPTGVHVCKTGDRREILREIKVLELLQSFLRKAGDWETSATLRPIYNAYFELLLLFIKDGSREDCLYLAQFLDNFLAYLASHDTMTLNVSVILVELIKDRREVLERLTKRQRDSFIGLVKKFQHPSCLQLLGTLCVCSDVAVPDNQTRICDKLFKKKKKGLYKLSMIHGEVHIAKDSKSEPRQLHKFLKQATKEEREFLTEQLHLLQKLVHGRNQHCIDLITKTTEFFTPVIAMAVLSSEGVPDDIRALFCDLLIVFFIDVGENTSILDKMSDTFIYDQVESRPISTADWIAQHTFQMDTTLGSFLPALKLWIESFLKANPQMVADQVARNMLALSVFKLMRALIVFGCCSSSDILTWIHYVLNLISGSQDLPFEADFKTATISRVFGLKRQRTLLKKKKVPTATLR